MNEGTIDLKESFETVEQGTHYKVPCYKVKDGVGIVKTGNTIDIKFVRGSKIKDVEVEKKEGTLHEHILAAQIADLKYKNTLVRDRYTSIAITKLEEALWAMRQRSYDRKTRKVQGTYKK